MATFPLSMPQGDLALPRRAYTLQDLLQVYAQDYLPTKAPATQYQQGTVFAILRRQFGTMLLTDFTPEFLRRWRDHLLHTLDYAPGTVRRWMDQLRGPFTIAVKHLGWLPENPFAKVERPPAPPGRLRILAPEEQTALLATCQRSRNPHLYALALLALSTGARKNELLRLRWWDVDLERGYLRLAHTKNHERRAVPLLGQALELLRKRHAYEGRPETWVFARSDGLKPTLIDQAFQKAVERAGLTNFHFHDLRHTAASYLAMSGANLLEISEVLGHKSIQQTKRYAHLTQTHTRGVVQRMTDQYLPVLRQPTAPPPPEGDAHV